MGLGKYKLQLELPPPVSTLAVEHIELRALLRFVTNGDLFLSDSKDYFLCHQDDIKRFLTADKSDSIKYQAEKMDCDDYTFRVMGQFSIPPWSALAMGIMWTNIHALLCFIGEDKKLYYLEPQTDAIKGELEPWQGTVIRLIMM